MIDESLQEQAALYAAGALNAPECAHFELILKFHTELRTLVAELEATSSAVMLAHLPESPAQLPSGLRARILAAVEGRAQQLDEEGFVMTTPEGLVEWVNPAFTAMCGYELTELRGKKLGPLLQGRETDPATVDRMRRAVHEQRPCTETILNYHKSGQSYWVEISLIPIPDDTGATRYFVATEREVPQPVAA